LIIIFPIAWLLLFIVTDW